jgi:hypothetical protein
VTRKKLTLEAGKILLQHDTRLRQRGHWIFIVPIEHITVGFLFGGSSDKTGFYLTSMLSPNFDTRFKWSAGLGDRIMKPGHPGGFIQFDDPQIRDKLIDAYEAIVQPWVPLNASFTKFVEYLGTQGEELSWYPSDAYCTAAAGDFDTARLLLDKTIADKSKPIWDYPSPGTRGKPELMPPHPRLPALKELRACLDQGPRAVADHLRANELICVQTKRIEKYWQPTPFPFE